MCVDALQPPLQLSFLLVHPTVHQQPLDMHHNRVVIRAGGRKLIRGTYSFSGRFDYRAYYWLVAPVLPT